jgi:hypothetical protein
LRRLALFLSNGDQVVDFSCGENYFVPHLKKRCLSMGVAISGRAYDIILSKDSTDFVLKSWFDAQPGREGLAPPEHLCICLNPVGGPPSSFLIPFFLPLSACVCLALHACFCCFDPVGSRGRQCEAGCCWGRTSGAVHRPEPNS